MDLNLDLIHIPENTRDPLFSGGRVSSFLGEFVE